MRQVISKNLFLQINLGKKFDKQLEHHTKLEKARKLRYLLLQKLLPQSPTIDFWKRDKTLAVSRTNSNLLLLIRLTPHEAARIQSLSQYRSTPVLHVAN